MSSCFRAVVVVGTVEEAIVVAVADALRAEEAHIKCDMEFTLYGFLFTFP